MILSSVHHLNCHIVNIEMWITFCCWDYRYRLWQNGLFGAELWLVAHIWKCFQCIVTSNPSSQVAGGWFFVCLFLLSMCITTHANQSNATAYLRQHSEYVLGARDQHIHSIVSMVQQLSQNKTIRIGIGISVV